MSFKVGPCASADFFPEEGKNFPGGARTFFLPKKRQKILFFPKKSKNILFLTGLGRPEGARAPPFPPLRTPMGGPTVKLGYNEF
jgi:hypothetical protein